MAFSPPVVGCLVQKGLQKGGSRGPQDPPGHAYELYHHSNWALFLYRTLISGIGHDRVTIIFAFYNAIYNIQ